MQSGNSTKLVIGSNDDLRGLINWQLERYRHIQLLSQGMLATSLTILTVAATVYAALGSPIPVFPNPETPHGPDFVGVIATQIIIGFAILLALLIGSVGVMMFVISIWKFIELVLMRPLPSEISLADSIVITNRNDKQNVNKQSFQTFSSELSVLAWKNRHSITAMQKGFRSAGLRFPISLLFMFLSLEFYLITLDHNVVGIVLLCSIFVLSRITNPVLKLILGNGGTERVTDPRELTLFQEFLLDENHRLNRLSDMRIFWWESLSTIMIKAISAIVSIAFILSYLF